MTDFDRQDGRRSHHPFPGSKSLLSLMLSLAGGSVATGANAQAVPEAAPTDSDVQKIETVTITATRRREPAREVPMQVSVLAADKLEQSGAKNLTDYLGSVPGIDVKTQGGAGIGAITLRGVSTGDQTIATVSTYLDDVSVGSSSAYAAGSSTALDMALLDLNHIELLRGPQGTLYGASSMGGLLKYVTNEPDTSEFSGQATIGTSFVKNGTASYTASGIVNVPLKEGVAGLRVAAFHERVGGFVNAVGPAGGKAVDRGTSNGARVSLLLEPASRFKIRLTATGQETLRDGTDYVHYDVETGQPVEGPGTKKLAISEPYSIRVGVASADVEYDFGPVRLNSITSFQRTRFVQQNDYSYVYGPAVGVDVVIQEAVAGVNKKTQEFRLTSKAGTEVEWIAGYYFTHEAGKNEQYDTAIEKGDLLHAFLPSTYREQAVYGDLTWNASKKFSITAGMRVARNNQKFRSLGGGIIVGGIELDDTNYSTDTSKTYLATAKYALDRVSNVYVRIASGYRPGGPNLQLPGTNVEAAFRADTLWSYEAGYKADLLGKTLSIESSVYEIRWDKVQQKTAFNGVNTTTNGATAQIDGAELAVTYRPSTQLTLAGSFAYNDARLTEDAPGVGAKGERMPNTARFTANLSANYNFSLGGNAAYVGLSHRYVGKRNAGFEGNAAAIAYLMPKYNLTNIQAGIDMERFQLGFFVRNVFNKRAQVGAETNLVDAGVGGPALVVESQPITVGATLTAKF